MITILVSSLNTFVSLFHNHYLVGGVGFIILLEPE